MKNAQFINIDFCWKYLRSDLKGTVAKTIRRFVRTKFELPLRKETEQETQL